MTSDRRFDVTGSRQFGPRNWRENTVCADMEGCRQRPCCVSQAQVNNSLQIGETLEASLYKGLIPMISARGPY